MIIYKNEASITGLAEKVLANQSIAYCSELTAWNPKKEGFPSKAFSNVVFDSGLKHNMSIASAYDSDLFFTKSILVSTNWNKNDDIFGRDEVWEARNTPSHKPTNLEHDETRLVGHITNTWAVEDNGDFIPDNTLPDDLPDLYHIANGAVIYTEWSDEDLIERTNTLIEEINAGTKFVSMEALFTNFNYAIITPENDYHVVARNQETSFLTKHLRIYGGTGVYDNCKVGRVLSNITFSGKGYVDKPANPHSVIFNDSSVFNHSSASTKNPFKMNNGVSLYCGQNLNNTKGNIMSDNQSFDLLKSQYDDLKEINTSLQTKVDDLSAKVSEAGIKSTESERDSLKVSLEAKSKELEEVIASTKELEEAKANLEKELDEIKVSAKKLEEEVAKAKLEKVRANRISSLVDGGVEKSVAEKRVDTFTNLTDEQFGVVAEDIIAAHKKVETKVETAEANTNEVDETDESVDESGEEVSEETIDDAEVVEEPNLTSDASTETEEKTNTIREQMAVAFASRKGLVVNTDSK